MMIEYDDILYLDTETTGIPPKDADWKVDFEQFPHICQLAWKFRGREENHIIYPEGWTIPDDVAKIHGITTERAIREGELFENIRDIFIADCNEAKLIVGHNIYFDISIIKAEIMRLGAYCDYVEYALYKGKRIDTMKRSKLFVGATFQNGRIKFPRLEELYARCFPGETFPAHDAIEDVRAVERCLPVLVENGCVTLEVRTYEQVPEKVELCTHAAEKAANGANSSLNEKDDKSIDSEVKTSQIEDSHKISNLAEQMLADDNF